MQSAGALRRKLSVKSAGAGSNPLPGGGAGDLPDEDVEVLHRPDPPSGVGEGYRGGVRGGGANISVHCRKLLVYQLN